MLYGRVDELASIDRVLANARARRSDALVIRGEAGIGKSTLLEYAAESAGDMRVLRGAGVESEVGLPFAGLHLLFAGYAGQVDALQPALAQALRGALGMASAPDNDRFQIGLAVLTLLADLAESGPLLCVVDDAHWLDHGSADALLFAARRLEAEGVALLFAARDLHAPAFPAPGLAELRLARLDREVAADLLAEHAGDLPPHVRAQILEEAHGNPLALLELPAAQREGGLTVYPYQVAALPTYSRIQQTFADRIGALPERTQDLLLTAAADATGDISVVLAAADQLGGSVDDLAPAEGKRLLHSTEGRVEFRHPLIRAAVYQGAPLGKRLTVHKALAKVFEDRNDAGRQAWHLAAASTGPDDDVAAALVRSAEVGRTFAGHGAVAAAYERAAELSTDPAERGRRLTAAAEAAVDSGQLDRAAVLADRAVGHPIEPVALGQVAMIRATLADEQNRPIDAYRILFDAAGSVAGQAPDTALCMLFWAVESAWTASDFAAVDRAVKRAYELGLPGAEYVHALARTATGLSRLATADGNVTDGMTAVRDLVEVNDRFDHLDVRQRLPALRGSATVAGWHLLLGDHGRTHELALALDQACRARGAFGVLPHALALLAQTHMYFGRHHDALASATEGLRIAQDIGQSQNAGNLVTVLVHLAAIEGDEERCARLTQTSLEPGPTPSSVRARCAQSLLDLSLGRHEAALDRLSDVATRPNLLETLASFPDLVEAAVRLDRSESAAEPCAWYREWASCTGQPWAEATALRCQALLSADEEAERCYAEAVQLHRQGASRPFERARTELLYGEWLRRARRPTEARSQLRSALEIFARLGARPWAGRAQTELRAAGESHAARDQPADLLGRLTPQELRVVRLAAAGLSNRKIGAQLFLSPRTVGYHLYKAYPKLGVSSRGELTNLDLAE